MRPLLLSTMIIVSLLLTGRLANAAAVLHVVNESSLPRLSHDGTPIQKRALSFQPEAVSKLDCDTDQRIRFPIRMEGFEVNGVLQAWVAPAGISCAQQTSRAGGAQSCWRATTSDLPLMPVVSVDIPVRNLIAGMPPGSAANPNMDASVCGTVDFSSVSVQFLYFSPGNISVASSMVSVTLTADTVPPARPLPPSAERQSGTRLVRVRSDADDGTLLRVFCSKNLAETDGGSPVCPSTIFGQRFEDFTPTLGFEAAFSCDHGQLTANGEAFAESTPTTRFDEGGGFSFIIAKVDTLGNMSKLSDPTCVMLDPASNSSAGAAAAAGSASDDAETFTCSASPPNVATSRFSYTAIAIALIVAGVRSARRRKDLEA